MDDEDEIFYKVRLFGTVEVGKSALCVKFIHDSFNEEYIATVEDSYSKSVVVDGEDCNIDILDTRGEDDREYNKSTHRYSSMRSGDGFLLVYSISDSQSLDILEEEFYKVILEVKGEGRKNKDVASTLPIILVGNKCDLEEERKITWKEGEKKAESWNVPFFETSAKSGKNVEELFIKILREIRKKKKLEENKKREISNSQSKSSCTII